MTRSTTESTAPAAPDPTGVGIEDRVHLDRDTNRFVRRRSAHLLRLLLWPMRGRVLLLFALIVAAQAARAAGPLLIAIGVNTALPRLRDGDLSTALWFGGALVAIGLAGGALNWWSVRLTSQISQEVMLDLRSRVFNHVQRLSLDFHEEYTSGRVIARQTSDLDDIRELLDAGVNQLLSAFCYMAIVSVLMFTLDPASGLIFIVASVPVLWLTRWFHRVSQVEYRSSRVASANLIGQFVETMTGMRAVQAFRREPNVTADQRRVSREYRNTDLRAMSLFGVYDPALILIGNITVAVLLAIDGYRMLSGELSIGTLIAAVLYAKRFFQPLEQMARFYNALQAAMASLEKISGLLEEAPNLAEPAPPQPLTSATGEIRLDGVDFGYRNGKPVIAHLDLHIPAGQTVALVGGTGAGKSTIAKLIARFYDVGSGAVTLDGIDVRQLSFADLRRHIVVVTQESYLFGGTIADNIRLGRPDATDDQVRDAARAVGADRFIETLPFGFDTDVNHRGGRLSAGQKQLVSFARAFIADPSVLILDEATSSLDLPSEALVQDALERLLAGRTAVIIAHRLSTVGIADRIVVLDGGAVVEDGTPAELRGGEGHFAQLSQHWNASMAPLHGDSYS
ncbi:ABC transporter ATP-binding protein [Millisia brevis]|uniref:ABC transporter ATP-binding protein n=1 Tax=Millisia brevis TaxID=264148 RepID=UPI0009FC0D57|nr:ABC transporter ATP-binding protein [Millisia brevis]